MPDGGVGFPDWGSGERVWEIVPPEEDLHRPSAASRRSSVKAGGVTLTCPLSHLAGKGKSPERMNVASGEAAPRQPGPWVPVVLDKTTHKSSRGFRRVSCEPRV